VRERSKTLVEMTEWLRFYFTDHILYESKAAAKFFTAESTTLLAQLLRALEDVPSFDEASIERVFQRLLTESGLKLGDIAQPARVALTGGTVSPGIHEVMAILGRERVLTRLRRALEWIASSADQVSSPE
jgi:glutamyl-tRNA synthetase